MYAAYVMLSLSGYGLPKELVAEAVNTPMWFFHGSADRNPAANVQKPRTIVNDILQAQGQAALTSWSSAETPVFTFGFNHVRYTEYFGAGHGGAVWDNGAYKDPTLYDWLLEQKNTLLPPAKGKTVRVNFTQMTEMVQADSQGRVWNNAGGRADGYLDAMKLETTVPFAVDATGQRTTVQVSVSDVFFNDGKNEKKPVESPSYDAFVAGPYWKADGSGAAITLSGLEPGGRYDLEVFAGIADDDGGKGYNGEYVAGGVSAKLNAANNREQTATLKDVAADEAGRIVLTITPVEGSAFAVINALAVTAK